MLLNVITVRVSPDLSNKTLVPSQSSWFSAGCPSTGKGLLT